MCRFDVLQPYKTALRSIAKDASPDPARVIPILTSQRWMLEAAGIGSDGIEGGMRVAGLAGMPSRLALGRGWLLRPLLDLPRSALRDYLARRGLAWSEDPTNLDARFDRNYLRQALWPALVRRWPAAVLLPSPSMPPVSVASEATCLLSVCPRALAAPGCGGSPFWRLAGTQIRGERRHGGHGGRSAACGNDERRSFSWHRCRSDPHRKAPKERLLRQDRIQPR